MLKANRRFAIEVAGTVGSCIVFLLTLIVPDWIEVAFRIDPDHHSGRAEWLLAGALLVVTFAGLARCVVDAPPLRSGSSTTVA